MSDTAPRKSGSPPDRAILERLYRRFNRESAVGDDPVGFLGAYPDPLDREITALVASSLAYGRVAQIHRSVAGVLDAMGRPRAFLERSSLASLRSAFRDFKHRFTDGGELASMLAGAKRLIAEHGSLGACFALGAAGADASSAPAVVAFARAITDAAGRGCPTLIPSPDKGSACKRLHLMARWMVRCDRVDPGGWEGVPPGKLLVPLDTHMHRIGRRFGFTARKNADLRTAVEITAGFARIAPLDPVRYDFALTRVEMEDRAANRQSRGPTPFLDGGFLCSSEDRAPNAYC